MKKILVGLDGSARQDDVLRAAIALARANDASLVLTRCVGLPAEVPFEALSVAPSEVLPLLEARALRELEAAQARVPRAISSRVRAVVGTPWQGIEKAAHEENVDLIVIGAHGYGGLDRFLGTTAAKVVNHVDCSVLVVRSVERLLTDGRGAAEANRGCATSGPGPLSSNSQATPPFRKRCDAL